MSNTTIAPQANPDRIARTLARRASGAAGAHQNRRDRRLRTRAAVRLAARREVFA